MAQNIHKQICASSLCRIGLCWEEESRKVSFFFFLATHRAGYERLVAKAVCDQSHKGDGSMIQGVWFIWFVVG